MQEWNDTERWDGFIMRFKLFPLIIIVITLAILFIMLAVQEDKKDKFNGKKIYLICGRSNSMWDNCSCIFHILFIYSLCWTLNIVLFMYKF